MAAYLLRTLAQPDRWRGLYRRLARHREYRRFIVLTRSRTGSNMLISCLGSHPAIHAEGEIFQRMNGRTSGEILDAVFGDRPRRIRAVGFKIFYYHPLDAPRVGVWDVLQAMRELHVIHLRRRNLLRTLVSRKIAGARDIWCSLDEDRAGGVEAGKQVTMTADELRAGFRQTREWEDECLRMFRVQPLLEVVYEDFVADPQVQFRRITDFLGLPYRPPQTSLRRQNPEPLRRLVINFEELAREFSGTEWAAFFSDEADAAEGVGSSR